MKPRPLFKLMVLAVGTSSLAAQNLSGGQVKLQITMQGASSGSSTYTHKLLPEGTKLVQLSVDLEAVGGRKVTVKAESTYGSKGEPLRVFHVTTSEGPRMRRQVVVTFDEKGAHAVEEVNGVRKVHNVELAPTAPSLNPSQFWFLRDTPKVGDSVQYFRFDVNELRWRLATTEYRGTESIQWNGKALKAHLVVEGDSKAWLDDKGLPYRMDVSGVKMERLAP